MYEEPLFEDVEIEAATEFIKIKIMEKFYSYTYTSISNIENVDVCTNINGDEG